MNHKDMEPQHSTQRGSGLPSPKTSFRSSMLAYPTIVNGYWLDTKRVILALAFLLLLSGLSAQTIFLGNESTTGPLCHCLDNATTLSDGQFLDTITINSGIVGETWTVDNTTTGAFSAASAAPPVAPISANGGLFTEVSAGIYQLIIRHIDGQGFQLDASNGVTSRSISNNCFYPDISFVGLPDTVCLSSLPVELLASSNSAIGNGSFRINGQLATIFNAQILGEGNHTVSYSFDAGTGTPNTASDPACSSSISKTVVVPIQPNTAVSALVNVNLGADCEAEITADMMLAGNYPCIDDFFVTVFDQNGFPIGNTVNGSHAGQRLNVRITSEVGNLLGDGQINVFDGDAPLIDCTVGNNMPAFTNDVQLMSGELLDLSATFVPNNFSCYNPLVAPMSGTHFYALQQISVTEQDVYTIELNATIPGGGLFGLYQGDFNPFQGPCQGLVGTSEILPANEGYYTNVAGVTRLHIMLRPGMNYTLLTMAFAGNQMGNFEYAFYSVNDGLVVGLPTIETEINLPLYCSNAAALINNQASVELLGAPIVTDACMLNPNLSFVDQYVNAGTCGTSTITRTFTVTDNSNNSNQCIQQINFPPVNITEVNLPPKTVSISCSSDFTANPEGNPDPSETGFPFVITADGAFNINQSYCNILASYDDLNPVMVCSGTDQFVRQWTIFDECDPDNLLQFNQLILIADMTSPSLTCSAPDLDLNGLPDTLTYGTQGSACSALFEVPLPTVTDDCSGWTVSTQVILYQEVPITNPFGQIIGFETEVSTHSTILPNQSRIITNIPAGNHLFRYTATDDCGNSSMIECPFRVDDFALPTAACDDLIHVSLGGNGIGSISAFDIDEGSNDNCGPVTLQIRRTLDVSPDDCSPIPPMVTPWAPSIDLYCCEAGNTIAVSLLVTDLSGNTNTCDGLVSINDTTAPSCIPPAPVNTSCEGMPSEQALGNINTLQTLFGMATILDQCADATLVELAPNVNMQNCGLGSIVRTFQASDPAGNTSTCQQLINFSTSSNYRIKFPKDVIGECLDPGADTLVINNLGCDQFTVTVSDEDYEVTNGACFKILRTYSVINWCEYDGFSPPVVLSRNAACLAEAGSEDLWVIRTLSGAGFLDIDDDHTNQQPLAGTRSTSCDGQSNPDGYWTTVQSNGNWAYTQVIKVIDSTDPVVTVNPVEDFCANSDSCEAPVSINFSILDACASAPPTVALAVDIFGSGQFVANNNISGSFPDYQMNGIFPIGDHRLRITVNDACGNIVTSFVNFRVIDCAAAGLVCNNAISLSLMAQPDGVDADGDGDFDLGAAAVNVNLFVNATGEDCTGPLRFTLHRASDIADGSDVPFPNHPALVVTCDDIGFIPVVVYLWDAAFNPTAIQPDGTIGGPNYTTCDAFLQVLDNNNVCNPSPSMGNISGLIITENGSPVSGIQVAPRDDMPDDMIMTENDGLFNFELATQQAYQVTPYSPEDYLNGVSTLDLIFISKHILGVTPLDSPYKMVAADINRSNSITTLDLVRLRKTILGITNNFQNNTSWRFINAAFEFPDPADPWLEAFPETVPVPMLTQPINTADFIAVKVGDVNGSAQANLFDEGEARASGNTYYLRTDDHSYQKGEIVETLFTVADEDDDVQGFQFTLQFDPTQLAFDDIEWGQIQAANLNLNRAEQGLISISWDANPGSLEEAQQDANLLGIRFIALAEGRISEAIGITSRLLAAEAYAWDDSKREIALNFAPKENESAEFFLEQNRPNPFGDQTIIGFQIPQAGEVSLTIYDTNGKVIKRYQQYYTAGYNQLLVDAKDILARGLLYYKLETDQYAATKKMIILSN